MVVLLIIQIYIKMQIKISINNKYIMSPVFQINFPYFLSLFPSMPMCWMLFADYTYFNV